MFAFLRSFFKNEQRETVNLAHPKDPVIAEIFGTLKSSTGVAVTQKTSLTDAAVYACAKVISEDLAKLPLILYRREKDGSKVRATDHPLYTLMKDSPNPWQTSFQFRELAQRQVLINGNSYALKELNTRGQLKALYPLDPMAVLPVQMDNLSIAYEVRTKNGKSEIYLADEILHIAGPGSNSFVGQSIIEHHMDTIGVSIAGRQFAASMFANNATPPAVLEHPGELGDVARRNLQKSIEERHQGVANQHRLMILEEGMSIKSVTMTPEESQMLESRQFGVYEICRIFRVQPHKVMELSKATFSNIEQQALEYVVDTLLPNLKRWEQALGRDLLTTREKGLGYFFEFNVDGLLRGDSKSRAEFYGKMLNNGILTINEIRSLENFNAIPDGDEHYINQALVRIQDLPKMLKQEPIKEEPEHEPQEEEISQEETEESSRFMKMIESGVQRIITKEQRFFEKVKELDAIVEFYEKHRSFVAEVLQVDDQTAKRYCEQSVMVANNSISCGKLPIEGKKDELLSLALGGIEK